MPATFPPLSHWFLTNENITPEGASAPAVAVQRYDGRLTVPPDQDWKVAGTQSALRRWLAGLGGDATEALVAFAPATSMVLQQHKPRLWARAQARALEPVFAAAVRELHRAGALTGEQARAAHPRAKVQTIDDRKDRRQPLPDTAEWLRP